MANSEIRIFDVERSRNGEITYAVICNGRSHFVAERSIHNLSHYRSTNCDGKACQDSDSETLDISLLTIENQKELGLGSRVPLGMVLVTEAVRVPFSNDGPRVYSGGDTVTPKQLEIGTLLSEGEGGIYRQRDPWKNHSDIHYVRNNSGKADVVKVGREGRGRTEKKLAQLRRGERKSEVSYEVSLLNARMQELMQLHRTSEVAAEIENVKELLRLASSLSTEATIEAAEGNEQIARELANARAREIGTELQSTRERLLLEQAAREGARQEIENL